MATRASRPRRAWRGAIRRRGRPVRAGTPGRGVAGARSVNALSYAGPLWQRSPRRALPWRPRNYSLRLAADRGNVPRSAAAMSEPAPAAPMSPARRHTAARRARGRTLLRDEAGSSVWNAAQLGQPRRFASNTDPHAASRRASPSDTARRHVLTEIARPTLRTRGHALTCLEDLCFGRPDGRLQCERISRWERPT